MDLEATQTIDIIDFVELEEIDPMFFDKPYYLEPQKGAPRLMLYARIVAQDRGKVGIAKVVIKTRQHLAAVKPYGNILVLEFMHFAEELVKPTALKVPSSLDVGARNWKWPRPCREHDRSLGSGQIHRRLPSALLKLIHEKLSTGANCHLGRSQEAARQPRSLTWFPFSRKASMNPPAREQATAGQGEAKKAA